MVGICTAHDMFIQKVLVDTAKTFHSQGNFLAEEILTRVTHTINRYDNNKYIVWSALRNL